MIDAWRAGSAGASAELAGRRRRVQRRRAPLRGGAHDDLRARGHEAWVETHWVRPQLAPRARARLRAGGGRRADRDRRAGGRAGGRGGRRAVGAARRRRPDRARCGWLLPRRATQVVLVAPAGADGRGRRPARARARTDAPRTRPRAAARARARRARVARGARARGRRRRRRARGRAPTGRCSARCSSCRPSSCWSAAPSRSTPRGRRVGDGRAETAALAAALALHDALVRDPPRGHRARRCCSPGPTRCAPTCGASGSTRPHGAAARARRRRPQPPPAVARRGAEAAGIARPPGGPRGLPAALAPPEHAEALARGLRIAP